MINIYSIEIRLRDEQVSDTCSLKQASEEEIKCAEQRKDNA